MMDEPMEASCSLLSTTALSAIGVAARTLSLGPCTRGAHSGIRLELWYSVVVFDLQPLASD